MVEALEITLAYLGNKAEQNEIDLYDAGQALIGFQRSLALTTHLIINNEIITQAPSLKGAAIFSRPPEDGSWKTVAVVVLSAAWASGSVPKDTPIGNLISSVYDYVIKETLGFHVDYSKSLAQQYEEYKKVHPDIKPISERRLLALSDKCTTAVRDMHRPIVFSRTANCADITAKINGKTRSLGVQLNPATFDYINYNIESDVLAKFSGKVSSYNMNSYAGRIYVTDEQRLISFYLSENCREPDDIGAVTRSLDINANDPNRNIREAEIIFLATTIRSRSKRLKKLRIHKILE